MKGENADQPMPHKATTKLTALTRDKFGREISSWLNDLKQKAKL